MASMSELGLGVTMNDGEKFVCVSKSVDNTWHYKKKKKCLVIWARNATRLICDETTAAALRETSQGGLLSRHLRLLPLSNPRPRTQGRHLGSRNERNTEIGVTRRVERIFEAIDALHLAH